MMACSLSLVARATPWEALTSPEAYLKDKEFLAVGNHALKEAWEDNVALKHLLNSIVIKVKSTDTNAVCIGNAGGVYSYDVPNIRYPLSTRYLTFPHRRCPPLHSLF